MDIVTVTSYFDHRYLGFLEPEVTIFGQEGGADPDTRG